ncbi:hypothetical protein LQW54_011439 [Pestalotiopsis sp. IQ-011]
MAPEHTKKSYTLASGDKIPAIGLGTWQSPNNATAQAVEAAIRAGYRYIDTALAYGNEHEVGEGVRAAGVPREQLWITTKLDNPWHKRVADGIDSSLKSLGMDYVDLYLMHWPSSTRPDDLKKAYDDWNFIDTWRELQKLVGTGKIVPAVNQIELHPNNPSPKLVKYCQDKGIHVTGYSCLGSTDSPLYKDETLLALAKAKGKTPQQCMIQWGIQRGYDVIPKSVTKERIEANFDIDGWELTDEEMKKLSSLPDRFKVCGDDWLPVKVFFGDDE